MVDNFNDKTILITGGKIWNPLVIDVVKGFKPMNGEQYFQNQLEFQSHFPAI